MSTCVLCAALVVGGHVSAAVAQTLEVGIVDFYGLRVFVEGVVIVGSILLAFGIEPWPLTLK